MKSIFLVSVPFTGLGLYGGFRGNRWLKNRIKIFEQFVIPSLLNQTDREFVLWIAWRREERTNKYVQSLEKRLNLIPNFRVVHTFSGIPFWDDKFTDDIAREKLSLTLQGVLPELMDITADGNEVHWLLQPSDDLFTKDTVEKVKKVFLDENTEAVGYKSGYICNYNTKEVLEYTPKTNPPFFAIKFKRNVFIDPSLHMKYLSLKEDMNQYKKGTPYPSHEYLPKCLNMKHFDNRGFLVGTHGENISTHFNHPYGGRKITGLELETLLDGFGIQNVEPLVLSISFRKWFMRKLPHKWQRKLRYIFGEKFASKIYEMLRN